jgi:hypothetical protein
MIAKPFSPGAALVLVGVLASVAVVPAAALAQASPPLAEVAKKEAERRKGLKESKTVLTNKDLPESARKPKGSAEGGAAAAPAAGQDSAPAGDSQKTTSATSAVSTSDTGQKDEKYWRTRLTQAREAVRRHEIFAEALQSRINALTTDFVNRDDPYQRTTIGQDRQKALDELARVKSEIEQARKQVEDIEEEARKAGVPPGWLR